MKPCSQHTNYFLLQYSDIVLFAARCEFKLMMTFWIWVLALKVAECLVCRFKWASYASAQKKESRCCTQPSSGGLGADRKIALCFPIHSNGRVIWIGKKLKDKKKEETWIPFFKRPTLTAERKLLKIISVQLPNKQALKRIREWNVFWGSFRL